jgi:chemotaxis protein CheX
VANIFETETYEAMTAQIVHDVFGTMLQYQIQESSEDYATRANVVTSAIFFVGVWKGAVVLECSENQAFLFTERLMGIAQPARMDDDVRDAMGEVVNMIGGNLKSALPPGVSLCMPSVLEGPDYAYRICESNQTARFSFIGAAGPLWITLVQVNEVGN